MGLVNHSDYDKAIADIEKKYGKDSWRPGDVFIDRERIAPRNPELKAILKGGVPVGLWTRFAGQKMTGKSLLAAELAAEAQAMGMNVALYNIEKQYDHELWSNLGVNTAKPHLTIFENTIIEEVCAKLDRSFKAINLHIIDSCSVAMALQQHQGEFEDQTRAAKARAWMEGFSRAQEHFNDDNTVIYIDHLRRSQVNPGQMYTPGGEFMESLPSLIMLFRKGKWLFYDKKGWLTDDDKQADRETMTGRKEADGFEITVNVEKSRVSLPGRTATLWLDPGRIELGQPWDYSFEYQKAMEWLGVLDVSGGWIKVPGYNTKVQGKAALRRLIRSDVTLQEQVMEALMAKSIAPPEGIL